MANLPLTPGRQPTRRPRARPRTLNARTKPAEGAADTADSAAQAALFSGRSRRPWAGRRPKCGTVRTGRTRDKTRPGTDGGDQPREAEPTGSGRRRRQACRSGSPWWWLSMSRRRRQDAARRRCHPPPKVRGYWDQVRPKPGGRKSRRPLPSPPSRSIKRPPPKAAAADNDAAQPPTACGRLAASTERAQRRRTECGARRRGPRCKVRQRIPQSPALEYARREAGVNKPSARSVRLGTYTSRALTAKSDARQGGRDPPSRRSGHRVA
jgi:hypothetical protein